MSFNLQLLFTGVGIGSIYALVALGFVLIYRATNVVNFAQGDFAMLGAFAMVVLAIDFELPYWLSILITLALLLVFGALFNLAVYYPLRHRSFLPVIISTIGAGILLENGVLATYGPRPQVLPTACSTLRVSPSATCLHGQPVSRDHRRHHRAGRAAIRDVREDPARQEDAGDLPGQGNGEPARHSGDGLILITFIYSAALGGLAGILVAPILFVSVGMGSLDRAEGLRGQHHRRLRQRSRAPSSAASRSASIETLGAAYISVPYKDAFAFLMLFAFLLVRPQGLFGERIAEKA